MSFKAFFQSVLRCEWLGEAEAAVDRFVRSVVPKVLRWRWRVAGVAAVGALFLVPLSLFALSPHLIPYVLPLPPNPQGPDVLQEHLALEDGQLQILQNHEQADFNDNFGYAPGTRDIHVPGPVTEQKLQQLDAQQVQALRLHQTQLRALYSAPGSLNLPLSQLPVQQALQQQEVQQLLQQQKKELRFYEMHHRSAAFLRALRRSQELELLALIQHFLDLDFRKTGQGTPFALRDLDAFDPLVLDFYPHPPGATLDLDNDYDIDSDATGS